MTVELPNKPMLYSEVEAELAHYGVRGMKWGVRKERAASRGPASDDAAHVGELRKRAKTQGIQSLSNSELRKLNERLQLEQTYGQMMQRQGTAVSRGMRAGNNVLNTAKKMSEIYNLINSPAAKALRQLLASQGKKN